MALQPWRVAPVKCAFLCALSLMWLVYEAFFASPGIFTIDEATA